MALAAPAGPGALSGVLTRLSARASAGADQRPWRGGKGGRDSLLFASVGVLFEVWLPLRGRRRDSRVAFLQEGAEVAVTPGPLATGPESESGAVREPGEGTVGEGHLCTDGLNSAP